LKKLTTLVLAVMLVLGSLVPVLAVETGSPVIISMQSIETLMTANSLNMALAKNNLDKSNLTYKTALSDYNKIKDQYDALVLTSPADWAQALALSNQLDALRSSLNSAEFNLDAASLIYNQQAGQFILAARQQYLTYISALTQNEISRSSLASQEALLSGLKAKLSSGYVSQKQVDVYANQVLDLRIGLAIQEEQAAMLLGRLRTALGIAETATVSVEPVTTFDFTAIPVIVFNDDLNQLLSSSTDIKTAEISLQSINKIASSSNDPSKYRYDILAAEIALTQTRDKVKADFLDQYLALKNNYNALQLRLERLNTKKADLNGMELKAINGFASAKQVQDAKLAVSNEELQILLDRQNLLASHIRYILTKQGF
jgi:outer membrane protein TolC